MIQARRLAIILNGFSLTGGEQSSIDLPHFIAVPQASRLVSGKLFLFVSQGSPRVAAMK